MGPAGAAIVGVGYSKLERRSTTPLSLLADQACRAAIASAGLRPSDIDGFATKPEMPVYGGGGHGTVLDIDEVPVSSVLSLLQAHEQVRWVSETTLGFVTTALIDAITAVQAGACQYALVWRAVHMPREQYMAAAGTSAEGENQFTAPYGLSGIAWQAAPLFTRVMYEYGGTREQLGALVVQTRAFAQLNPDAYFHGTPMTLDDYLAAPMIADPVSLLDCDVPVDGCVAVVVTSAERARRLPNAAAHVTAYVECSLGTRRTLTMFDLRAMEERDAWLASQLWGVTGLSPTDMSAAMLYDGFSIFPLLQLAGFGFCRREEAFDFIQGGTIGLGGGLPLNTFGGSLSQGRLHALGHVAEAALQASGRAGARQVANAQHVLVVAANTAIILSSSPR